MGEARASAPDQCAEGLPAFDTSEHETYTEEEPNALTSEETAKFLACMKEEFPGQYAMTFLGSRRGFDLPRCALGGEAGRRPMSSGTKA